MQKALPYIAILVSMLIWAASGIFIQHALVLFRPFTMIMLRFSAAVLLMLAVGLALKDRSTILGLQRIRKGDVLLFLLAGILQPVLYYILETYCYGSISSPTIAEALLSVGPLIAPLLAWLVLREKVTLFNILGILISTAGMFMLVLVGSQNFDIGQPIGILFAITAVCSAVMYTIVMKKIPAHYSPLSIVFYGQLTALAFFIPLWAVIEGRACMEEGWMLVHNVPAAMETIGYLSVCSSVIAFILYCYTVRQIGVTQANAFNNVRPVFTAIIMLIIFGEHLPIGKWMGILLIVGGLFICQYKQTTNHVRLKH